MLTPRETQLPFQKKPPTQAFRSFKGTPFTYVDTEPGLRALAAKLKRERIFAVDLENHSLHSYQGFLCLMQISTRTEDFIVDCLALRREIGPALGGIFADGTKVKVIHGANSDVLWLQRDLGIYVANLFDTGQAARALNLPKFGLAFLLQHYCNYNTDKRHQMADWRVRPLPGPLSLYARADTHFLLYIYDRLKMELSARRSEVLDSVLEDMPPNYPKDLVGAVLWQSAVISLQMYEKPAFTETSYLDYYYKQRVTFDPKQLAVFAGLFAWRDAKARDLDESPEAVLARTQLVDLSRGPKKTNWNGHDAKAAALHVAKVCARKDNFSASHQEEVCEVIASSVKQDISHGSKRVSGPSAERGRRAATEPSLTGEDKCEAGPMGPPAPQGPVVARARQVSEMWGTLDQTRTNRGDARVDGVLASLKLPFLQRGDSAAAVGKKKSPQEDADSKLSAREEGPKVSEGDIRAWADAKAASGENESSSGKSSKAGALPQSLSKRYQISKSRNQRPAKLDGLGTSKPASFDYSAAREQLKSRKQGKKRQQNAVAQSFYAIPDENLVKPAKRRKQPTTGNRSMTYK